MNNLIERSKLFFERNSPTILSCIGAVGVVFTAVLTAKAAVKASKILEEAEEDKGAKLTAIETAKAVGLHYIPAAVVGVSTIACIFGANILNKRQQASLASAYALINSSYKEYKSKLKELYGEEAHNNIVDAIAVEKCSDSHISAVNLASVCSQEIESDTEPRLFYDEYSGRYFETTIERVLLAEYHLNREYISRGFASLNDFYKLLGLETTDYGETVGWDICSEIYWIDFDHRKTFIGDSDDLECYIIEMPYYPEEKWIAQYEG